MIVRMCSQIRENVDLTFTQSLGHSPPKNSDTREETSLQISSRRPILSLLALTADDMRGRNSHIDHVIVTPQLNFQLGCIIKFLLQCS